MNTSWNGKPLAGQSSGKTVRFFEIRRPQKKARSDAIAACVVGGVSTSGGIGTVPGMLIGVLIFSIISYGLTFINMNPYWQQIIKGAIIITAVAVDIKKYLAKR